MLTEEAFCFPRYGVAGRADVVYLPKKSMLGEGTFLGKIIDIKTGRKPDFWAAAWQLSFYRYISKPLFSKWTGASLEVLYLEDGEAKFKDVSDWIADAEVEALLEAYKNGTLYDKQAVYALIRDMTEIIVRVKQELGLIESYKKQEERATEYLNKTKNLLLEVMDKHGVDNGRRLR